MPASGDGPARSTRWLLPYVGRDCWQLLAIGFQEALSHVGSTPNRRVKGGSAGKTKRAGATARGTIVATRRPASGPAEPPRLRFVDFAQSGHLSGWPRWTVRSCGALLVIGAIAGAVGQIAPFAAYGGVRITAHLTILSVLAILLIFVVVAGAGLALMMGSALRAGLAIAGIIATVSIGYLLTVIYQGSSAPHHEPEEFLFGQSFQTTSVSVETGYWAALIATIVLIVAGLLAILSWFQIDDVESIPLEGARAGTAFAAGAAGMCALIGFLNPPFLPAVRSYIPPGSLLAQVVDVVVPPGPFDATGLLQVAGLSLAIGVGICGFVIAILSSRLGVIGALIGLGAYFAWATLNNIHDALEHPDLVSGVRTYLLLAATLLCAAGGWYGWIARRRRSGPLGEETAQL